MVAKARPKACPVETGLPATANSEAVNPEGIGTKASAAYECTIAPGQTHTIRLRLTRKGRTLYEELIPRLLRKEQDILSCLSAQERKEFAALLGKIEKSLDLVQNSQEADAKEAY